MVNSAQKTALRAPLFFLLLASLAVCQGLPLIVQNPGAAALTNSPVSLGVPLQKAPNPITEAQAQAITVVDSAGNPVPCQFKVLSRWDGPREDTSKPLKWVLVTLLASVPAHSTTTYFLAPGIRPAGQMVTTANASVITVSPRPGTTFVLDRTAFSVFNSVQVNGQTVVAQPGGGVQLRNISGATVGATVTETVVEEAGLIRSVVRQRGLLSGLGLAFTCRWYFHSGQDSVAFDFRLENPGAYGLFFGVTPATKYFDSLYLSLPIVGAGATVVTTGGTRALNGQPFELTQDCVPPVPNDYNILDNFNFAEKVGTTSVGSGQRSVGSIDIPGTQGGVTITVERFWQNFPKSLKVVGSEARIGLWPEWGHGPEYRGQYESPWSGAPIDPLALSHYRYEGGRWKTSRIIFDFHAGVRTPLQLARGAEAINRPVAGRPHPSWTKHTQALGILFSEKRKWTDDAMKRMERFSDLIADDSAADDQLQTGRVGLHAWWNRGGVYGGKQQFGWENYGDITWGEGYANLHYDWPLTTLLGWYRGGSYEFFDVGRDMAAFRRDYGQNHSTDSNEIWRGIPYYEKGWWHGNAFFGDEAHTWVHGLLLHHVMTGDEASREAVLETMNYLFRYSPRNWAGLYDARLPGWSVQNLLDIWHYFGIAPCLDEARAGIARFQHFEQQNGGQGYVMDPSSYFPGNQIYPPQPAICQPWMSNIMAISAARYTMSTGDLQFAPLLDRMRTWWKNDCILPGSGPTTNYTLPSVVQRWSPTWINGTSTHLLWPMIEALTHTAIVLNSTEDANLAQHLFGVMTRFHQAQPAETVNFNDASQWSPIAMRMLNFPGSESKIMGNALLWSLAYPALQTLRQGTY